MPRGFVDGEAFAAEEELKVGVLLRRARGGGDGREARVGREHALDVRKVIGMVGGDLECAAGCEEV